MLVGLLLECIAWASSQFTYTNLDYKQTWFPAPRRCKEVSVWVWSSSGQLEVGYLFEDFDVSIRSTMPVSGGDFSPVWFSRPAIFAEERGFRFWRSVGDDGYTRWSNRKIGAPHWFVSPACFVLAFFLWLPVVRSARRASLGRCRTCGYDLRATPDRCPECGAPAEAPPRTAA